MTYVGSTQQRKWTYTSVAEVDLLRREANSRYCERASSNGDAQFVDSLLRDNDEKLILLYFQPRLVRFCQKFKPKMPRQVVYTAMAYFKRFYLRESTMNWHPDDVKYACAYLATKTEEFNVSLRQFCGNLKEKEREVIGAFILDFELTLIEVLHFELTVHSPLRALGGYLTDFGLRQSEADPSSTALRDATIAFLEQKAMEFLDVALYTDSMFVASPSQIALCAFCVALPQLEAASNAGASNISSRGWTADSYLSAVLAGASREDTALVSSKLALIKSLTNALPSLEKSALRNLKGRLKKVRNAEHNPFRRFKPTSTGESSRVPQSSSSAALQATYDDDSNSMDVS